MAIVDHHLGIPLGEVESPATPSLPPRHGRGARVPFHLDRERLARRERRRELEAHDRAVRGEGIQWCDELPGDAHVAHMIEREVGLGEVVEPAPPLDRIGIRPAGAGPERIQVEVQRERRERIGRAVHVPDALRAREHARRFIEARRNVVGHFLLPVRRRHAGRRLLSGQRKECQGDGHDARECRFRGVGRRTRKDTGG